MPNASSTGKLKIFSGMSPGVGKTYAMLQAGREKRTEGVDVVAGMVETPQDGGRLFRCGFPIPTE